MENMENMEGLGFAPVWGDGLNAVFFLNGEMIIVTVIYQISLGSSG